MAEPKWLTLARKEVGLSEIVGPKHEPRVLAYYAEAGHPEVRDDETAWCAAFANAMLSRAGVKGTGSLAARSFLKWGCETDDPKPGDIVVFSRGNSTWQGHVAFFLRLVSDGTLVEVLGGNQNNAVNVARFPTAKVLGYRKPGKKKTMAKSKEGNGAIATGVGGSVIAAGEVARQVSETAETASTFMDIIMSPNFIIAVLIVLVAGGIWYWRRRRMKEDEE